MGKYIFVLKNSLQEYFAYRLNFILWRVRGVVSILITYFLWLAIFKERAYLFGYRKEEMLTYIILITFLNGIVLSTQTHRIAQEINLGVLSNFLIKPINYISYNLFRDLADKILSTLFSVFEICLFILLLRPPIFVQTDLHWLGLFIISLFFASLLYFEISLILSFIGFWSQQVWAPRFLFLILVSFLAGTYFPLDILPSSVYNILQLLPFTYLIFFPLKIYLGKLTSLHLIKGFVLILVWIPLLLYAAKYIWKKGLAIYTAEGQ